ncbi:MAG: hypothetical protein U1C97_03590 [Candidatus Gracilibacteria bacterium]|nr:hypothetical protein [bacterium]MDZ4217369.1 hypothetical protein [Candidatus Gracilibacteria bacterium]
MIGGEDIKKPSCEGRFEESVSGTHHIVPPGGEFTTTTLTTDVGRMRKLKSALFYILF